MLRLRAFLATFVVLAVCHPAWAYLPTSWNAEHARSDFQQADLVAIARVIRVERVLVEESSDSGYETSAIVATLRIGQALKGKLAEGDEFHVVLGLCSAKVPADDATPCRSALCNTQAAYDLRINEVYVLSLVAAQTERSESPPTYDLRSGPFSAGWLGMTLLVDEEKRSATTVLTVLPGSLGSVWQAELPRDEYLARLCDGRGFGE